MCMSRCVSVNSALYDLYDPKQKKGIWRHSSQWVATKANVGQSSRFLFMVGLTLVCTYFFSSLRFSCHMETDPWDHALQLRRSISRIPSPLAIRNAPKKLAWKKAEAHPRSSDIQELSVDFASYFNPSILELEGGRHIFSLRMAWLYHSGCERFTRLQDDELFVEAMFLCEKHHKERKVDHTLLGEYDPLSNSLVVRDQGPSLSSLTPMSELQDFDFTRWDSGAFWHDTRLVFPYNHRPVPGQDEILITSQSVEILTHKDLHMLGEHSNLVLQLTFLASLDPNRILSNDNSKISSSPSDPLLQASLQHRMTRWLYYDKELERQEWDRRTTQSDYQWKLSPFDVARMKCKERLDGLPALPFDSSSAISNRFTDPVEFEGQLDHDWYFIKDKNWSPFAYDGKVLWSYSLAPNHVVCENDIDLSQHSEEVDNLDCVLCVTKYNSSSTAVFDNLYSNLHEQGYDDVVAHINGAPAYFIPEKNVYLGVMHVIKVNRTVDDLGWEKRSRTYEHYFYTLEATPPFAVTSVSSMRVPLERSRGYSHWFDIDDVVTVEFVMYMQYHPDRPGQEIVLSYGDGDKHARLATLSLGDVFASF